MARIPKSDSKHDRGWSSSTASQPCPPAATKESLGTSAAEDVSGGLAVGNTGISSSYNPHVLTRFPGTFSNRLKLREPEGPTYLYAILWSKGIPRQKRWGSGYVLSEWVLGPQGEIVCVCVCVCLRVCKDTFPSGSKDPNNRALGPKYH